MVDATVNNGNNSDGLLTDDGQSLKAKLALATRRNKTRAFMLVAPLLFFIIVTFVWPIGVMLYRSVNSPQFTEAFSRTAVVIKNWDGQGLPSEKVFTAFVADMVQARKDRTIGRAGTRINYELPGTRSLFTGTARKAKNLKAPFKQSLIAVNEKWANPEIWAAVKRLSSRYTLSFYLAALDLKYDKSGEIVQQPEERQIYVALFLRTFWISGLVMVFTIILGYPVAYLLSILPLRTSNLLMIMVLLPFWTSLLVRTTAWIALLQREGVINDVLVFIGVISDENRIQMIYNQAGTIIAMTHILLPFMVLPLFSVMKTIPPSYMRAARSLGATQFTAYTRVYMPQTLPGIGAGSVLVFILSVGYYITPALVGGRTGTLISNVIAGHMQQSLNWGLAAALGAILLASVLVLYWFYNKIVGVDNMKFG